MRRRDLLGGAVAGAVLAPFGAAAQQPKIPTIGLLVVGGRFGEFQLRMFREGLRDLGYIEGSNIRLDIRSAEGNPQRLPVLADALVRDKVDVIVPFVTSAILAAKQATSTIPIVLLGAGDPVGMGIVASFARPGGNITGTAALIPELAAKHVELSQELLPGLRRIAALCNVDDPLYRPFLDQIERAGMERKVDVVPVVVAAGPPLDAAFPQMASGGIEAVIVHPSLTTHHLVELSIRYRLPAVAPVSSFPGIGGLLADTGIPEEMLRRSAVFVDKILKGARPADLPLEQPTHFRLVINLKTAKALGLAIPPALLARADEVLE